MGIFRSLAGSVRVSITSADPICSLVAINGAGIPIWNLQQSDELTAEFTLMRKHLKCIQNLAESKGEKLSVLSYTGLFWTFHRIMKRPLLIFGCCILTLLTLYLPGRVLFVEVEGNITLPDNVILEAAKEAGITFGQSRRRVRSEKMKNELLGILPQLQWAGVNTYGCTAVITVRERVTEMPQKNNYEVSNIVAAGDGVVTSCTIISGSALCTEGQAVKEGQVLISGFSDCGGVVLAGRGQGEVYAKTRHEMTVVSPIENSIRGKQLEKQTHYSLCLGKKRINFYKGSGIYTASYVKMVAHYQLTLPGNFKLPLTLIKEEAYGYQMEDSRIHEHDEARRLSQCSKAMLCDNGIARVITDAQEYVERKNGLIILHGVYHCTEMIGREQGAQIGDLHGKTD